MSIVRTRREFLLGRETRVQPHARIGTACLDRRGIVCQACRDTCQPRAIRFLPLPGGASTPVVDDARCNGCGECVATCPAQAILLEGSTA